MKIAELESEKSRMEEELTKLKGQIDWEWKKRENLQE